MVIVVCVPCAARLDELLRDPLGTEGALGSTVEVVSQALDIGEGGGEECGECGGRG